MAYRIMHIISYISYHIYHIYKPKNRFVPFPQHLSIAHTCIASCSSKASRSWRRCSSASCGHGDLVAFFYLYNVPKKDPKNLVVLSDIFLGDEYSVISLQFWLNMVISLHSKLTKWMKFHNVIEGNYLLTIESNVPYVQYSVQYTAN